MSTTVPAIEARGLTKEFGGARAVDAVDLVVPAGGVFALLGTNGAGKTTTVRMLATLLRPDSGDARIFGHDVVAEATAVRSLIGVTGQYASVDEDLTARENLMIFGRLIGSSRRRARIRADELLDEFGLGAVATRRVGHFSGGMRRRLDLAASLITRPRLLFLDEPTTGLDPRTRAQMWQTVRDMVARGSTVLLTTQYLDEADELADHIAVMDRGRVVADGTADDLKAGVGDMSVRLELADADDLTAAARVCAPFTSSGEPTIARREGVLVLPMADIDPLADILGALRARGLALTSVNVVRPTLDEVFFALTDGGDPTRTAPAAAEIDSTGVRA
ncbi:daunorubicin/doxorubicin resistance ABC transporter ATP-binding protein DrrA [Gordonia terrae]|uniref:Daunorubicin/doxorubicin resistance ABC transporter ATP-binding protein DrrA n=1 Tax=Gordonia terrae TaxID=2055 RepID=A0A2I1RD42_9ACTN|nr:ATP-binding cassette domain-containing protein [Gordonia terrae]PKZ67063.1 daunorubicin/doxorubicin resistance ABC transporter ATP-binding protein DrrA [Gordonia terrae]